jgi:cell filamentation protein
VRILYKIYSDNIYCYPGTNVLKNNFDIRDQELLKKIEREYSYFRISQLEVKPIKGNFDLRHLQQIHKYIFQDVYSWAGELRQVNISKGKTFFCNSVYINNYADEIFTNLKKENFLKGLDIDKFSNRLAYYASEINILHPFREGNGRSTREFIRCLASNSGYEIYYSKIQPQQLCNAFVKSVMDYSDLASVFKRAIIHFIKEKYVGEIPGIINASDEFIKKLDYINKNIFHRNYTPIKHIKDKYISIGKEIEKGIIDGQDANFRLLSDIIIDIRKIQVNTAKDQINKENFKYKTIEKEL